MSTLKELEALLKGMTPEQKAEVDKLIAPELAKPWRPNPGPQTEALNSKADLLLYGGAAGGGKRLDVSTPIPTPIGWSTMGDLCIGDEVFAADGQRARIVSVSGIEIASRSFEVEFDTGEVIVADGDHLWVTTTAKTRDRDAKLTPEWRAARRALRPSRAVEVSQKPWVSASITRANREREHGYLEPDGASVRTTDEIAATLTVRGGRINHAVDVAGAIDLPEADLPIDPYLLGLWLGDGNTCGGVVGMSQDDMAEVLAHVRDGIVSRRVEEKGRKTPFEVVRFVGLQKRLRSAGLYGAKHIPLAYMRASRDQRLALLHGLMDTDGTCDKRGQCEIALSDDRLIGDVHHLLATLGIKSQVRGRDIRGGARSYRLKFVAGFPVFRLGRKLARQKMDGLRPTTLRRYIVAVRPTEPRLMRCIGIDHPSHQYLVGASCISTHNTDLLCGLALTEHERSVIFRRQAIDLQGFWDRLTELSPVNKQQDSVKRRIVTTDGRLVETGHLDAPGAEMSWQGRPHDFIGFDEGAQLTAYKVNFVLGWLRSATGRRCRAVIATNPPIGGEGQWLLEWFAPWLDAAFDNPAMPGELRWAVVRGIGDEIRTVWVDGPEPVEMDGETYYPLSRTFIPSLLSDNPYLDDTNYRAQINSMPEPMRSQLLYGDFTAGREDHERQVIPSAWVDAAQERWVRNSDKRLPMTGLGVDVAQGGKDKTVLAPLHRHRFEHLITYPGETTPDGPTVANHILSARRNDAVITIDLTGGWGGSARDHLKTHHEIPAYPFVASEASGATTQDLQLGFTNLRSESWWALREALDVSTGPDIELPPDPKLRAELTAPLWTLKGSKIQVESKDEIRKRLGSSTDHADAVLMAWHNRGKAAVRALAKSQMRTQAVEQGDPLAGF